jgi:type IV secretory pathway TrbD component
VTLLQWVGLAAVLGLVTLILGLIIFVAFARADRQMERRRNMRDHPSRQSWDVWDDDDEAHR